MSHLLWFALGAAVYLAIRIVGILANRAGDGED